MLLRSSPATGSSRADRKVSSRGGGIIRASHRRLPRGQGRAASTARAPGLSARSRAPYQDHDEPELAAQERGSCRRKTMTKTIKDGTLPRITITAHDHERLSQLARAAA